ncbi:hypothetical protein JL720_16075 [Aureococcus anophagefferens]|nr:hypothetical protein JL720_16075 [Aureococcus anophagefferens]
MAKTGKQELGIAVSGAWAATLLDRWASLLGGERENNVARLVVGDVRVTAWDVSKVGRTLLPMWAARVEVLLSCLGAGPQECLHGAVDHLEEMLPSTPAAVVALADARAAAADAAVRRELERFGVDYYPSPPPPGVGGETGAFDAGARAMLEGLLKRRFAALPDLLRVCIPRELARDDAGGGGGVAAFYESAAPGRGGPAPPAPAADAPAPAREPAVRWRESAPAFGETAAVVMPEPVDRFDELAATRRGGASTSRSSRRRTASRSRATLGVAAALFRAAATDGGGVDGRCVRRDARPGAVARLAGCGITKMVNVNVAKLEQRFGDAATVDVEVAVADEADDLATDERTISAIATRAYQKTLAKHHNWVLRPRGASR